MHLIVHERRDESDGVVSLTLRHPDGAALPSWTPCLMICVSRAEHGCRRLRIEL